MKDLFGNILNYKKIERKFYNYTEWEDYKNGMYSILKNNEDKEIQINKVILILSNQNICYNAMEKVIKNWNVSCKQNLTNLEQNRKAWLGQAACNIEENINEECIRLAWVRLSTEEQNQANKIAEDLIKEWEYEYAKNL